MNDITNKSNQLVEDFKAHFTGKISEDSFNRTLEGIEEFTVDYLKANTSYSATGSIVSLLFYVQGQCTIADGKTFNGKAWGISFPGGGALWGDVYLAPKVTLDQLYSDTSNFVFLATPAYTAFWFKNASDEVLGSFHAGSVSTATGTGGGSGKWS